MPDFAAAFEAGQQAARNAADHRTEIAQVLGAVSKQLSTATNINGYWRCADPLSCGGLGLYRTDRERHGAWRSEAGYEKAMD